MSEEILKQLAGIAASQTEMLSKISERQEQLEKELHTKAPGNVNGATLMHGNTGIFSSPVERDVISAHTRPTGLAAALPVMPTVYESPLFASLTGFSAPTGAEADAPCSDAPKGYAKGCNLTAQFGRLMRQTNTIEVDKIILKKNRGDFSDLRLVGQLLNPGSPFNPGGLNESQFLDLVVQSEMITVGVNMERELVKHVWQGNPANNTPNGGYKEFPGLDLQIATGHQDAETGVTCPALDSTILDFGYDAVGGTGRDIVTYISNMEYVLRENAERMGLDPATWAIVMNRGLWFELSAVWPCSYLSNKCQNSAGTNIAVINDTNNVTMRDNMRNGMYIHINGNQYPVIVDDGIYEHNSTNTAGLLAGQYASSVYMVPMTIAGGMPVTYLEYLNYNDLAGNISLLRGKETFWTDNGRFLWTYRENGFCFDLQSKTEMRVILRTPQLAGKIQHVKYSPLVHLRDSDPESPYWVNGGVSLRTAPTYYSAWNPR